MSLKVWLPLTGDLRNLGTSNYEIAAYRGSVVYHNNGRIGKCFHSNGANNLIIKDIIQDFYNYPAYSICAWACADGQNTGHTGSGIISAGNWNSQLINLAMSNWSTDHYTKLRISGSNWNRTYDYNFQTGIWYHIVVCDDGDKTYAYVNGELIGNSAVSFMPTSIQGDNICIGGATYSSSMNFVGRINDVRIYDHCLSLSEIKEISQGLILHYKLNGNLGLGNPNLLINSLVPTEGNGASGITKSITNDGIQKVTAASSNGNWVTFGNHNTTLALTKGDTFTFSLMIKSDDSVKKPTVYFQSGLGYYGMQGAMSSEWSIIYYTGTWSIDNLNTNLHLGFSSAPGTYYIKYFKLEKGSQYTPWAPAAGEFLSDLDYIQDSSGYNHNGEIISELHVSNDSARYKNSTLFDGIDDCIIVPYNTICPENIFTINLWFKKDALGSKNYETLFGGPGGFEMDTRAGSATSLSLYMASTRNGNRATGITMNEWHMITMTRDGTAEKYYVDGEFKSEIEAKSMPNGIYRIGAWASNTGQNYYGLISDFRIYATPLLDSDIKKLYNTSMSVDKVHRAHTFELEEKTTNLLFPAENSRIQLEFGHGLSRYTQANCQVTLTQDGYHIYRPPNYTPANNGNTMWGGLKLVNQSTDTISPYNSTRDNIWGLTTGHTYLITFMVTGQSSNGANISMNHNMGNGVSNGIGPSPTVLAEKTLPVNFEGTQQCYRIFTINDNVVKTCNKTGAGYTIDEQYLSYRHIVFGFGYSNTGALGTDLYLTHFQLYDITDKIGQVLKNGIVDFSSFNEENIENAKIQRSNIFFADGFIER